MTPILADVQRLAAFTDDPAGGNPAGVWIGDVMPPDDTMQAVAASVGYSETAFVAPSAGSTRTVRYFSPLHEVPFCGHATIATGVALALTHIDIDQYQFTTEAGPVAVDIDRSGTALTAALTSVEPHYSPATTTLVDRALSLLGWRTDDLDLAIPPAVAYAGAFHLVLAVKSRERLADLNYDFEGLSALMTAADLTTLQLIWRESDSVIHARNPFPVGGVVEDPATGAAAAALGGYLREAGLVETPAEFVIHQGVDMGQPSKLQLIIAPVGGITVAGTAVPIDHP